jgi:prepilin-type N-terminal cleavage/methylation domain-containing protein
MKKYNFKKGFTLIELVVVIAILGILAGIAIPRFMDATASARGAKMLADMRTVDSALQMYYMKVGKYPQSLMITQANDTGTGGFEKLTTDDPANGCFRLLAEIPRPITGSVIFPCKPGVKLNVTSAYYATTGEGSAYAQVATTGRCNIYITSDEATISNKKAEDLAEGGAGW